MNLPDDLMFCPDCRCPIQRTREGDLVDGLRQHQSVVHQGSPAPRPERTFQ